MISKRLLIVGHGTRLQSADAYWREQQPEREITTLEVSQANAPTVLDAIPMQFAPEDSSIFVAIGMAGMNLVRLEILSKLISLGFHAESFIHRTATVAETASVGINCWVAENVVIGPSAKLDYNIFLGQRTVIGLGVHISHSVWIGSNCVLTPHSDVGMHCVLGDAIELAEGVKIGRFSNLQIAQRFNQSVPSKTFIHEMFDKPVRIYG